jgi:hypothetical protein
MIIKINKGLYIYIEKKVFYNIEGQLRGLPRINLAKTCAPKCAVLKSTVLNICTRAKRRETPSQPSVPRRKVWQHYRRLKKFKRNGCVAT